MENEQSDQRPCGQLRGNRSRNALPHFIVQLQKYGHILPFHGHQGHQLVEHSGERLAQVAPFSPILFHYEWNESWKRIPTATRPPRRPSRPSKAAAETRRRPPRTVRKGIDPLLAHFQQRGTPLDQSWMRSARSPAARGPPPFAQRSQRPPPSATPRGAVHLRVPPSNAVFRPASRAPVRPHVGPPARARPAPGGAARRPVVADVALVERKRAYAAHWAAVMASERAEEERQVALRVARVPRAALEAEGLCAGGLTARRLGRAFAGDAALSCVLRFERAPAASTSAPWRLLVGAGDSVRLSRGEPVRGEAAPPPRGDGGSGVVQDVGAGYVDVAFEAEPPGALHGTWRLDVSCSFVTFDRCAAALAALTALDYHDELHGGTFLRDAVLGYRRASDFAADPGPAWLRSALGLSAPTAPEDLDRLVAETWPQIPEGLRSKTLNDAQVAVVCAALQRRLVLVQGPPGTGKTNTILYLVGLLVRLMRADRARRGGIATHATGASGARLGLRARILCTAQNNVAVDNLLDGLKSFGVQAVRIGRTSRVREDLRGDSLEARMQEHPGMAEVVAMRHAIARARSEARDPSATRATVADLGRRVQAKLALITNDVFASAEVVCSTCAGAGSDILAHRPFQIVVFDEATQTTEPATLIALVRGSERVVMLGDHFQLPPNVMSRQAAEAGLGVSLFQRLVTDHGVKPILLTTQYRMHPGISRFPSRHFYGGLLSDGDKVPRAAPTAFPWPNRALPVAFLQCAGSESASETSISNGSQARAVADIVCRLLDRGVAIADIGVVTPYAAQVKAVRQMCSHALSVHSVDGFQGREKDYIVLTTVRANARGAVGFLRDWRRLNVAITRARLGLILIGDAATLCYDAHWCTFLRYLVHERALASWPRLSDPIAGSLVSRIFGSPAAADVSPAEFVGMPASADLDVAELDVAREEDPMPTTHKRARPSTEVGIPPPPPPPPSPSLH
jgi:hypothetical protein